jgi:hypothetical protein
MRKTRFSVVIFWNVNRNGATDDYLFVLGEGFWSAHGESFDTRLQKPVFWDETPDFIQSPVSKTVGGRVSSDVAIPVVQ